MASSTPSIDLSRSFLLLGLAVSSGASCGLSGGAGPPTPTPVLWAWDRPEDLTFLAPGEAAVAFLAGTVELNPLAPDTPRVTARRGSLAVPHGVERIAVVRIEAPPRTATDPDGAGPVARAIESLLPPGIGHVQLDLDATPPQRPFYRALLTRLSTPDRTLSVTALASWCWGDPWLEGLPIAAAVPMLYRMGPDGPAIRDGLARGEDFRVELCRAGGYGLSDDEPIPRLRADRRRWLFSQRAWNRAAFDALLAESRGGAP